VGGPDLLPHRPWQRLHSYPHYTEAILPYLRSLPRGAGR
jgi:hypothetical protein